jgi:hypothetical protein
MPRNRIPREVLERARAQATRVAEAPAQAGKDGQRPSEPQAAQPRPAAGKRDKIVRALRKLHPMD